MKFYLDTANLDEIKEIASMGILDGVTTNPSLLSKEGKEPNKLLKEICEIVKGPVSAEVIATEHKAMVEEARALAKISPHIIIKCPITREGIKATKILSAEGLFVNATLCFSPSQALIAARAGATYVSPFVGRLDDISSDGMDLIRKIRVIFDNYGLKAQIISASLRHSMHVVESALAGADIATMPHKVMMQCFEHPLTDIGLKKFLEDWGKVKSK